MLPTYPDYVLQDHNFGCYLGANVRLKRKSDDKWFLVPVIVQNDYQKTMTKNKKKEILLETIKFFHNSCYRCLLFHLVPKDKEIKDIDGYPLAGEKDPKQITEKERLGIGL